MKFTMKLAGATLAILTLTIGLAFAKAHYPHTANSTAYCDRGDTAMQKPGGGAYQTHRGIVAMNNLPLGTKITTARRGPDGRRRYIVRDRIGWGSELDFWVPSCERARRWGRRDMKYRIGWSKR